MTHRNKVNYKLLMLNFILRLYIQTTLLSGPSTAVIQTRECWATSTAAIDDAVSYTLIRDL